MLCLGRIVVQVPVSRLARTCLQSLDQMLVSNVLDWMSLHGVKCCIRLDGIVVLFTPRLFLLVKCCACENQECRVLCLLPRLCCLGALLSVKVCWRKPTGTEDSSRHPEESTEDRPARRLRADDSVEASWEDAPDKFGFGAGRRRRRVEDAGRL